MVLALAGDVELEVVGASLDIKVGAIVLGEVLEVVAVTIGATPRDLPVVVHAELQGTSLGNLHVVGLPCATLLVVGEIDIASPVVEVADDGDVVHFLQAIAHGREIDVDLVEASTSLDVFFAILHQSAGLAIRLLTPVVIPVVGIGLELELAIEVVVALVLAVEVAAPERVGC